MDTRPLVRLLREDGEKYGWDKAAEAGLIAICPVTDLEFLYSARTRADRVRMVDVPPSVFCRVPVDDRAYDRAWQVQEVLTRRGEHRRAGAVDLVVAATAELRQLTLLHRDRDVACIAAVTGQDLQWYGPESGR